MQLSFIVSPFLFRCAEIAESITSFVNEKKSGSKKHKELYAARVKRDHADYLKLKSWFVDHNPFKAGENLVALDTGLSDVKGIVTCDRAEEIGQSIQTEITGKSFATCSFKRKNQVTTLQRLYSSVKIGDEKVTIDPLTLFLRLVVMVERKPDQEVINYFEYELCPYPMSLFKDGVMRSSQKSKLKSFMVSNISSIEDKPETKKIADGGALMWCCNWKKNQSFETISKMYADFLHFLNITVVVFDGYSLSTKDVTHQKRSGNISSTVEVKETNKCPSDRNTFLTNYSNKGEFVKYLASKLRSFGFQVFECPSDADTTIVKVAIEIAKTQDVTVYSDDTDVLCLLVHHFYHSSNMKNVYMSNMTRQKDQARSCYSISEITNQPYLLFAHAFTGCDTTSAIHRFGKTAIFKRLENSKDLREIADMFNKNQQTPEEIGKATIAFFEALHSPTSSLAEIRKRKYEDMILSSRSNIDPSILPPSPRAAFYHGLRVYHQLQIWLQLLDTDFEPLNWGWEMKNNVFAPIMTDKEPGPQDLMKMIRCNCKESCDKRCSCKKAGLNCSISCGECLGTYCTNAITETNVENEIDTDEFQDRHFLDIFNE